MPYTAPMRVFVTAKPRAREDRVERIDATHFVVSVREPPTKGRANRAIVDALAHHLGIPRAALTLRSGATSRRKVFEIGV